jgi:Fic family protein
MTIVTKKIKGKEYYYFQDSVKLDNNHFKNISTYVGRTDLSPQALGVAKNNAATKQIVKMYKAKSLIRKTGYHFENKPSSKIFDPDYFEYTKVNYQQILANSFPEELDAFEKTICLKYVHGSTAIEGNTLSEEEAGKVLFFGLSANNKPLSENIEIANYNDVKKILKNYHGGITEKLIMQIHLQLMKNLIDKHGISLISGRYRTTRATIEGVWYTPPPPEEVEQRMHYLLATYNDGIKQNIHPIELISIFHQRFEEIHPFQDGNGRTGREILNYMLKEHGFPPIYIPLEQRRQYLDALEEGNNSNFTSLIDFVIDRINKTMWLWLSSKYYEGMKSKNYENMIVSLSDRSHYARVKNYLENLKRSQALP